MSKRTALFLTLIAAAFALRAELLAVRFFDPDELQHLQASFLIARGWVPHRDFFEHHNHLLHYFLLPLLGGSPGLEAVFSARILMLLLAAGIVVATALAARSLAPPGAATLAAAWLALDFVFLSKTLEIRPDVPATLFLVLGLLCLLRPDGRGGWSRAGAGLFCALAWLCTQKAGFPIMGLAAAMLAEGKRWTKWTGWTIWTRYGIFAAAFLIPILAYHLYFQRLGVLPGLVRENYLLHFSWKHSFSPLLFLSPVALFDPFLVVWSGAGIVWAFREFGRDRRFLLPAGALIGGALGALISPVVYAQYYAMLMPCAAILASAAILRFLLRLPSLAGRTRILAGAFLVLPALLQAFLVLFSGYRYPIRLENGPPWAVIALAAGLAAGIVASLPLRPFSSLLLSVCLLAAVVPRSFNLMLNYRRFTNEPFLRAFRTVRHIQVQRFNGSTVQRLEFENERVFDGWTGLGVFHFPAYYYGFLHHEILLMLSEEGKGDILLRALKDNRPAVVIRDHAWHSFSPGVQRYIGENYATAGEEWLGGEKITVLEYNQRPIAETD